jgi:hypothetical protein
MHRRTAVFMGATLALTALLQVSAPAQPVVKVTGIITGPDGNSFAIVKDIGMVKEGDTIDLSHADTPCTVTIVSIDRSGVKVHVQKHFEKEDPGPDPDALRDPFQPVGDV